jgi:hypothetical protein
MRYRMEVVKDELVIRNVEMDIKLGSVVPLCMNDPHDPNRVTLSGCTVLNKDAVRIATISTTTVPNPLEMAAVAVANYEAAYGYPNFKGGTKNPDTHRIEWLLGTLLADTVSEVARGLIECGNGGLKAATKRKCTELIAQLHAIWYASRFRSFDGEHRVIDPYFAGCTGPRMTFADAAQYYGMFEFCTRFPDVSETTLKALLSWPLEQLTRLIDRLAPHRLSN